jgi:two-component system, sensor histidine kinase LadS
VSVHIEVGEREAQISVTDTGSGIPQAGIEAIFDEYRQLGSSNLREKGAGLGLFIARKLVTMHGGTIGVRSELGQGSEFTVRVPVWGSGELAAAAGLAPSSVARAKSVAPGGAAA